MPIKKEPQIYGIPDFIWCTSLVLISAAGVYQSHTLESTFWTSGQLIGWQYIWLFFTFFYMIALAATIEEMLEV